MKRAGLQSNVLNIDPRAPASSAYIKISGAPDLVRQLFRHISDDWGLSVHTNGHNPKSWFVALVCGIAAQFGPAATLTLHSGGVPVYLNSGPRWRRFIARLTCFMYSRIVCVNAEIARAISGAGVPNDRLEISPAFLPVETPDVAVPREVENWIERHSPVLSTAMFFRPEYGFDLLIEAVTELRKTYRQIGCVVLGDGDHRDKSLALVRRAGLDDAILLAGDVDHELCVALMARSDVFLRPTFTDGDSISVREALGLGVPVVASNVGTRPEGTLLFPAGNARALVEQTENALSRRERAIQGSTCLES
ncbi:MAG TPA: glycosyltransferase family 4 protein [Terriglobia bacterium]|nr:glycosyltransferase family 4 protein [Terriglobia bacterium]